MVIDLHTILPRFATPLGVLDVVTRFLRQHVLVSISSAELLALAFMLLFIVGRRTWRAHIFFKTDVLTRYWLLRLPRLLSGDRPRETELRKHQSRVVLERLLLDRFSVAQGAEQQAIRALIDRAGIIEHRIYTLRHGHRWERLYSAALIGEMRSATAVNALTEALNTRWNRQRLVVLRSLAAIGSTAAGAAIAECLFRYGMRNTSAWIEAAAVCVEPKHYQSLLRRARGVSRVLVVRSMAESKFTPYISDLNALVFDPDPLIRAMVARALARVKLPNAAMLLSGMTVDESRDVRLEALEALGYLQNPLTVPAILLATSDPDAGIRECAARSLVQLTAEVPEVFRAVAANPRRSMVLPYIEHLARAGLLWRNLGALVSSEPESRRVAEEFFYWVMKNGYHRELLHAVEVHPEWRVRVAAARILTKVTNVTAIKEIENRLTIAPLTRSAWLLESILFAVDRNTGGLSARVSAAHA